MQSLNDGTPEVRDAAFSALAAIAKVQTSSSSSLSLSLSLSVVSYCTVNSAAISH
jgi:hypothetical protein